MKVLVTGGAGYIGSSLIPLLLNEGCEVVCYDLLMHGIQPILPYFVNPRFSLIEGDILDNDMLIHALKGVNCIIHLASIVGAPACAREPELAYAVNVQGVNVVNNVRGDIPLIFSSTGSIYGKVEGVCTEDTPPAPLSDYGKHKTYGESVFLEGGNAVILRFATAYGLSPRLRLDLLPNEFTWRAVNEGKLDIYEPHFRRTFLNVRDIARSFIHAMRLYDTMRDSVWNVGDQRLNMSKLELAELIGEYVPFKLTSGVGHDIDMRDYDVSYAKIAATGFEATITMAQGISEMVRAFPAVEMTRDYANA